MRTLTVSLRLAAVVAGAVLTLPLVVSAQNRADLKQRYGNAIGEVYRASNGLIVTAYFDERGNICRENIESENRGRRMTDKEVNSVLDEIAPKDERGKYKMGAFLNCQSAAISRREPDRSLAASGRRHDQEHGGSRRSARILLRAADRDAARTGEGQAA
jgi:hypothetical protein